MLFPDLPEYLIRRAKHVIVRSSCYYRLLYAIIIIIIIIASANDKLFLSCLFVFSFIN